MRKLFLLILIIFAVPVQAETVAIVGAQAWTNGSDQPIENATIIVENGRIIAIVSGLAPPSNARIIDAEGRPVTPALNAAMTQIGLVELGSSSDTDDRSNSSGPLGAAFDVALAVDPNLLSVQEARAQGVARAMVFPGSGESIFAGTGALLRLTTGFDIVEQPRAAMFMVSGGGAGDAAGGSRGAVWTLLRNAFDEVRGDDGRGNAPRDDLLNALDMDALRPVLSRAIPLAVIAHREADIRQAIAVAQDYRIRLVILGGAEAWRVAGDLAASDIPVILDPLDELPASYDMIGARRDNAALLHRAGVRTAFSVSGQGIYLSYDVGPALREGAGIAVANGLPYAAALRAITQAPGQIWGSGGGTLAVGQDADLVVWDGDPLEPASAPVHVFVAGREISRETRQTLLRDRYHPGRARDPLPPGYR
jgi:imidazolonepropionase-like amidohydrolase